MIGRDEEMRRFAALLRRSRAAAGRPTVLVLDGPPGIGCRRLLREMATAGRDMSEAVSTGRAVQVSKNLIVAARQHVPADTPAEVQRMVLGPLGRADVRRLVEARLGTVAGERLLDLVRVAAGRPGAVLELVADLREEGLLRGGEVIAVRLPERTRARLAHRLAGLSPAARHLVQVATALRSPFPPARLSALLGDGVARLVPHIEEALDSGLLVPAGEGFGFSHDLVRAVAEASMPHAVAAALRHEHRPGRPRATAAAHPAARQAPRTADWSLLSERELEIAELVGQALTNRQIATRLGRSPHTVNYHLRQIFRKLGLASRVELVSVLGRRESQTA